ncbi:hypothetical protein X777_06157 [Ooceraea biroi]|uniref:Integrase zinc-binding domain-containing protein n=1 Tax=Ooceraea biroi TaxID=2015173 RepID=A0A026WDY7_OOCBI|nr:hypothetical protein X777_06157 [Ooceraea biroi]
MPRTSRLSNELTTKEFIAAEIVVLRLSQQESFDATKEQRLNSMDIYKDENGLIRLKSPMANREDEYDFRHPIVLDPKHPLTKSLIEYTHQRLNHAGIHIVMSTLRERFWVLSCRATVRSVIHRYIICKRHRLKKIDVIPGNLPNERIRDANVFEITGIDYVGPLFLKGSQKAWISLFTCAIYTGCPGF